MSIIFAVNPTRTALSLPSSNLVHLAASQAAFFENVRDLKPKQIFQFPPFSAKQMTAIFVIAALSQSFGCSRPALARAALLSA